MKELLYLVKMRAEEEPIITESGYTSYGCIGEETKIFDINNEMIYVGDLVRIIKPNNETCSGLVLSIDSYKYGEYYTVQGMDFNPLEVLVGIYEIERISSYTDLNQKYKRYTNYIALTNRYLK